MAYIYVTTVYCTVYSVHAELYSSLLNMKQLKIELYKRRGLYSGQTNYFTLSVCYCVCVCMYVCVCGIVYVLVLMCVCVEVFVYGRVCVGVCVCVWRCLCGV